MKANELREMQTAELTSKLADLKSELFNLRFPVSYTHLDVYKRQVRYKSCRPAICVDAGGCRPAIAEAGYFRGVCPILEPGEKITDSDGICSSGEGSLPSASTRGTNVRI